MKYPNGDEYSGEMKANKRTGEDGSYVSAATQMRYRGSWLNDRSNGNGIKLCNLGTLTYENGDEVSGTFIDGRLE